MEITGYRFGCMEIGEHRFRSDLILSPEGVMRESWWRDRGHLLQVGDLAEVLANQPEIVVIGTGYYGRMKVPDTTRHYLDERGIELIAERTGSAVERFNELQRKNARIVGAFHLTC